MFIWEPLAFFIISLSIDILCYDRLPYVNFWLWRLPNYILSIPMYVYYNLRVSNNKHDRYNSNITIFNARYYIVNKISDMIVVLIWSFISPILTYFPSIPIYSYINAINVYEYRSTHIPTFRQRVRYVNRHIYWMMLIGYPLACIQCSNIDWFVKHHLVQFTMYMTVILIWLL